MVCDQEVLSQEKVQFAGRKDTIFAAVIDAVDDNEQVGGEHIPLSRLVFFYLRRRAGSDAVLDGKRVEVEDIFQNELGFLGRGVLQVHPQEQVGIGQQSGHQEHVDVPAVQLALGGKSQGADHQRRMP